MQFWVYLLRCADGSYYTGHSDNFEGRLSQHQEGTCCDWTRRRRPIELVWCEAAPTRYEALAFERRIKGGTWSKKEALIASDWDCISWLARPPHERPSTSLRTNEGFENGTTEGEERPSTSLRTNEVGSVQ